MFRSRSFVDVPAHHPALGDEPPSFVAPVVICIVAPIAGAILGAMMNTINGRVSADYFAIVMSWDWATAPTRAIFQGALEGFAAGLLFGFFFAIVIAASTRLRCPPPLALRTFFLAMAIVVIAWVIGGVIGVGLSLLWPKLWGFFFVGVPPRVNLPRFAWVGGSIWGAYGGSVIALIVASITLHLRWRQIQPPRRAFAVLVQPPPLPAMPPTDANRV
jgi:hypothetical protein